MALFAALAPSIITAGAGFLGASRQNRMAQASARERMAFEREEATRQMDFQERMSSTAYQRAAKDLSAAGLNRILAVGSPASSPSGAAGSGAQFNPVNEIEPAVSSALAVARAREEVKNAKRTGELLQWQRYKTEVDAAKAEQETALTKANWRILSESAPALVQANQATAKGLQADLVGREVNAEIMDTAAGYLGRFLSILGMSPRDVGPLLRRIGGKKGGTTKTSRYDSDGVFRGGSVSTRE